jgi:hypothetical protein
MQIAMMMDGIALVAAVLLTSQAVLKALLAELGKGLFAATCVGLLLVLTLPAIAACPPSPREASPDHACPSRL